MPPESSQNVVFDVVGTLVGYERFFQAIDDRMGHRLRSEGIKPSLLGQLWIEMSEREYTYLSLGGRYLGFGALVKAMFFRSLFKAGIAEPRAFASSEDLEYIIKNGYDKLQLRPGARECIAKLRQAGFTVWALTAADVKGCAAYFEDASIDWPAENLLSCDSSAIGKPDPEAYKSLLKKLTEGGQKKPFFAAAHSWDTSAAKNAGYAHHVVRLGP